MDKEVTNEDLARIIKGGFDGVDKRFEQVDKRFEQVDKRFEKLETKVDNGFNNLNTRIGYVETKIENLEGRIVYRQEFEDTLARISNIEDKLGIVSGK